MGEKARQRRSVPVPITRPCPSAGVFTVLLNFAETIATYNMSNTTMQKCSWRLCSNPGKLRCTRCRDATPQRTYCSAKCQKEASRSLSFLFITSNQLKWNRRTGCTTRGIAGSKSVSPDSLIYPSRFAYTFNLTLVGSSNPIIKRTFDVPCWFTFRQLHGGKTIWILTCLHLVKGHWDQRQWTRTKTGKRGS